MVKVLCISIFIALSNSGFDKSYLPAECDKITLKAEVSPDGNRANVKVLATGGQAPSKIVFYKKSGELLSENFDNNVVNGLEKGQYYCTVVDKAFCKKTLEIEVK